MDNDYLWVTWFFIFIIVNDSVHFFNSGTSEIWKLFGWGKRFLAWIYFPFESHRKTTVLVTEGPAIDLVDSGNGPLAAERSRGSNRQTGELMTLWDMLNKENSNLEAFFNMSQCITCSPVWRFLYHVIVQLQRAHWFVFFSSGTISVLCSMAISNSGGWTGIWNRRGCSSSRLGV